MTITYTCWECGKTNEVTTGHSMPEGCVKFPRVVWENPEWRLVVLNRHYYTVEVKGLDAMGRECWYPPTNQTTSDKVLPLALFELAGGTPDE